MQLKMIKTFQFTLMGLLTPFLRGLTGPSIQAIATILWRSSLIAQTLRKQSKIYTFCRFY